VEFGSSRNKQFPSFVGSRQPKKPLNPFGHQGIDGVGRESVDGRRRHHLHPVELRRILHLQHLLRRAEIDPGLHRLRFPVIKTCYKWRRGSS